MAIYAGAPQLLRFNVDVEAKHLIDFLGNIAQPYQFTVGDVYSIILLFVEVRPGPTYNYYTPLVAGSSVGLTDGKGIHYADGVITGYSLFAGVYPSLLGTMTVDSASLTTALTNLTQIPAFFEIRTVFAGTPVQKMVSSDPCVIFNTSLYP